MCKTSLCAAGYPEACLQAVDNSHQWTLSSCRRLADKRQCMLGETPPTYRGHLLPNHTTCQPGIEQVSIA